MTTIKAIPKTRDGMALPLFYSFKDDPEKRLKEIQDLDTRESDILVNCYPKSGNHWLHEILCMLLYKELTPENFPKLESAFLELIPDLSRLTSLPSPRILYTHLPVKYLPRKHVRNGGKIFHMIRDPRDIVVSSYYHFLSVPEFKESYPMQWDQHLSEFMSGDCMYGEWFQYELLFEQFAKTNNVMVLLYEDMKTNGEKALRKIAEYLEIPCTPEKAAKIVSETEIMKVKERRKSSKTAFIYRKGEIGGWRNHFSKDQEMQFNLLYQRKMRGSSLAARYLKLNSSL